MFFCPHCTLSRAILGTALIFLIANGIHADETEIAKALKEKGAEVTQTKDAVTGVSFRDCSKLGDDEFRQIGRLAHLKKLVLYGQCKGLNDQTLAHLTALSELEELHTDQIQVSDDALKQLTALKAGREGSGVSSKSVRVAGKGQVMSGRFGNAQGLNYPEGPYIYVEGIFQDREVYLQVLAYAPEGEEPGLKLDATRKHRPRD